MRATLRTLLFVIPLLCGIAQAATVNYEVEVLGGDMFRLSYDVSDVVFARNQELELRYHAGVFRALSNPAGPSGFDILLLQPDNPLGAPGILSALALFDSPGLTGGFAVDVRVAGAQWPGPHKFSINELDDSGKILRTISEGDAMQGTPEPSTLLLTAAAFAIACAAPACRGRFKKTG